MGFHELINKLYLQYPNAIKCKLQFLLPGIVLMQTVVYPPTDSQDNPGSVEETLLPGNCNCNRLTSRLR